MAFPLTAIQQFGFVGLGVSSPKTGDSILLQVPNMALLAFEPIAGVNDFSQHTSNDMKTQNNITLRYITVGQQYRQCIGILLLSSLYIDILGRGR